MDTLVMGDIHNGYRALLQVLDRAKVDFEKDRLIFLGDYVDGWSEAAETLNLLIEIQQKSPQTIFLKGNHDAWAEKWIAYNDLNPSWLSNGGGTTHRSLIKHYLDHPEDRDKHAKFMRSLHNYYIDDLNRCFVHGGYTSHRGCGNEPYETNYYWDRTLVESAMAFKSAYDKHVRKLKEKYPYLDESDFPRLQHHPNRLKQHTEIFVGHTATVNWDTTDPIKAANLWNVDTGAGWYGRLTIMDVTTKQFWQSDMVSELYLDETCRS